jgi:cytochrome c oxidase subunit 1
MFGRMMNNKLGNLHFWVTIVSTYGVFFPMHFLGLAGVPRRYYTNSEFPLFDNLVDINELISIFAIIAAIGQLLFMFNFIYSALRGPKAPKNPWRANSLEWSAPVEHIHGNWYGDIPEVYRWPYDYSKVDENGDYVGGEDFIPQTTPLGENEKDGGH